MLKEAAEHLKSFYPDWNERNLIYDKWHKDKGQEAVDSKIFSNNADINANFAEKPQKDKVNEPPEGFYFLED